MSRKDILTFLLDEARNEFCNALAGLTPEDLAARPVADQNPIGWIVCHCMKNANWFLYEVETGRSLLVGDLRLEAYDRYSSADPTPDNPAPDLSRAVADLDRIYASAIASIAALDGPDLDRPGPRWQRSRPETRAVNCLRVINHSNAHIREIWLLRWALGRREEWPHQTLYIRPDTDRTVFYVPDRATILRDRRCR